MSRFTDYVRATRGELAHVSWPTRSQVISYTAAVVIASVVLALFLGFFDFIFTYLLGLII